MSDYIYTEDGGILIGEDGAPMLAEGSEADVAFDVVTPFFDLSSPFVETAVLIPPDSGKAVAIPIIFDSPFSLSNPARISFESSAPSCFCQSTDVDEVNDTYTIYISGTLYYIKEVHPDGTGITELVLSKDPIA